VVVPESAQDEIGEDESVTLDDDARLDGKGSREHRARDDARVKLAALAAGIDAVREIGEERRVEPASGE
jgi:hypothetical protein